MTLKAQNLIILGITGLWIIIILIPILLPYERGAKTSLAIVLPPLPPQGTIAAGKGTTPSPEISPEGMQETWDRDPFTLPAWVQKASAGAGKSNGTVAEEKTRELNLTATISRGNRKMAAINHRIVQEGETIEGEKVLQIGQGQVTLGKDGGTRVLTLKESQLPLKITIPKRGENKND